MSNEMKLGNGDKASWNKNVGAENKKAINVNGAEISSQSASLARGGYMDLEPGTVNPINPANRDTYQ